MDGTYPTLDTLIGSMHVVAVPLTTRFRGITEREAVLFDGPAGWGEFAPFPEYAPPEAATWLAAGIEAGWGDWPAPLRQRIPVNVIVPAVTPDRAAELVRTSGGCRTAKVKVAEPGQSLGDDIERLAAVRTALDDAGPDGRLRIDANGAWTVEQAALAIAELAPFGLEYVEQPCATLAEQAELRRCTDVPLAADEGVRKAVDPERVAGLREAADLIVLKVAPLGGVRAALRVAEAAGLPAVVSSALDTSVGLAAGAALAAALPALPYACGLGSGRLLSADVADDRVLPVNGMVDVGRVAVNRTALVELAVSADRLTWWKSHVGASYAIMSRR